MPPSLVAQGLDWTETRRVVRWVIAEHFPTCLPGASRPTRRSCKDVAGDLTATDLDAIDGFGNDCAGDVVERGAAPLWRLRSYSSGALESRSRA